MEGKMKTGYIDKNNNEINVGDILKIRALKKNNFFGDYELGVVEEHLGEIEIDRKYSIIDLESLDIKLHEEFSDRKFVRGIGIELDVEIIGDINLFPEFKENGYKI